MYDDKTTDALGSCIAIVIIIGMVTVIGGFAVQFLWNSLVATNMGGPPMSFPIAAMVAFGLWIILKR